MAIFQLDVRGKRFNAHERLHSMDDHPDSPCTGKSPGGGDASGGMAAHGLVKAAEKDIGIESP